MNPVPDDSGDMAIGSAARERPYRILAGLAVSLAVHALLLFAYRHANTPAPSIDTPPDSRSITVWLRPPPPPPAAEPLPEPAATPPPPRPARQARAKRRPAPVTELIAVPDPTPGQPEAPDVFAVEPPKPPADAPRFDRDAALKTARTMANEPDPAKVGTAVAQIPQKPYASDTKMARAITSAKRRDCKDGLPGGLLAPIFLLLEKKDSGCKW